SYSKHSPRGCHTLADNRANSAMLMASSPRPMESTMWRTKSATLRVGCAAPIVPSEFTFGNMRVATKLTLFSAFDPSRPPLRIRTAMVVQSGYDVSVGRRDFIPNHCIVSLICVDVVTDPTRRTRTSGRIPGTLICHVYPTWFNV